MADSGAIINVEDRLVYYRKRPGSQQLQYFWEQQDNLLRLSENMRRRASGLDELTIEQLRETLQNASKRQRMSRWRRRWGKYYYRTGSTHAVNAKRAKGMAQMALSFVMSPARVVSGVRGAVEHRLAGAAPGDSSRR